MRRFVQRIGVSGAAWIAIFAIGSAALAAAVADTTPTVSLSPEGAIAGKTIDSDDPFEMTVHLQAEPSASYSLAVTYGGDAVGTCQANEATLGTNEEGQADWTCTFDTAENSGDATLNGTVTFAVDGVGSVVANLSVRPAEDAEEPAEEPEDGEEPAQPEDKADNHGQCVSGWAHHAKAQGLHGRYYGQFISDVAQSDCTGFDEAEFAEELQTALDAQAAAEAEAAAADEDAGGHGQGKAKGKGQHGGDEDGGEEEGS